MLVGIAGKARLRLVIPRLVSGHEPRGGVGGGGISWMPPRSYSKGKLKVHTNILHIGLMKYKTMLENDKRSLSSLSSRCVEAG